MDGQSIDLFRIIREELLLLLILSWLFETCLVLPPVVKEALEQGQIHLLADALRIELINYYFDLLGLQSDQQVREELLSVSLGKLR